MSFSKLLGQASGFYSHSSVSAVNLWSDDGHMNKEDFMWDTYINRKGSVMKAYYDIGNHK